MSTLITPILHAEDPSDGAPDILEALSFAGGMVELAVWEDITVVDNDEPMVIGAANAQIH